MSQRLQVVVDDRLDEAVKALAGREGRSVSEWLRTLLAGVVARAESNGALELPGWCVGCGAKAGKGELVCQECADLMEAEDAAPRSGGLVSVPEAREDMEPMQNPSGKKRPALEPKGACPHPDLGPKRTTSFGFARDCKVCGEVLPG